MGILSQQQERWLRPHRGYRELSRCCLLHSRALKSLPGLEEGTFFMICCQILLTCPFPGHLAVVDKLLTILSSQLCQIPKVSRPWLPATAVVCWGRAPGHTWWKHRHIRGHSPFLDCSLPGSHLSGPVLSLEPSLMYISRSQVARCSLWLWSRGLQRCSDCFY